MCGVVFLLNLTVGIGVAEEPKGDPQGSAAVKTTAAPAVTPPPAPAVSQEISLNDLLNETQKMSEKSGEMTLVWWVPEEYWRVSLAQDPTVTETQVAQIIESLRPYTVFFAVSGTMGPFGGLTFKTEPELRAGVRLKDGGGNVYSPLPDDQMNPDARNFLSTMKPVFANTIGPMGQNMHFFLFSSQDAKGKPIARATQEGNFSLTLGREEFRWRLPLSSLLPPKICPTDGEKLSGAWKYCPWHGTQLPEG